jgi:hypothetical protein
VVAVADATARDASRRRDVTSLSTTCPLSRRLALKPSRHTRWTSVLMLELKLTVSRCRTRSSSTPPTVRTSTSTRTFTSSDSITRGPPF